MTAVVWTSLAVQEMPPGKPPVSAKHVCAAARWVVKNRPIINNSIIIPYRAASVRYRLVQHLLRFFSLVTMV
jgi:hypothetical protein